MKNKIIYSITAFLLIFILTVIPISQVSFLNLSMTADAASIKLNKTSTYVTVDKTVQLKLLGTSVKPKWSTSNKLIATVTSTGVVKGIKAGNVTVTATSNNKKYSCNVIVKAKEFTDEDMIAFGWILLRDSLKNPDSLKVNSIKIGYEDAEYGDGTIIKKQKNVLFDYSAQNGYGGTNRSYATINFYPFEGEPSYYYITSDVFKGYLTLSTYDDGAPELYDVKKFKAKNIQPLVESYLEEENYECY